MIIKDVNGHIQSPTDIYIVLYNSSNLLPHLNFLTAGGQVVVGQILQITTTTIHIGDFCIRH